MIRVLIISPFFVPVNAADMHRVRQSLAYYKENECEVEVVYVDPKFIDLPKDELLNQTIPSDIKVHKLKALNRNLTRYFGLGSIAYRSMFYYWHYVNKLLKLKRYDLIFFSTTAYPITILGRLWKKRYGVPYIIDMQDPWRSDHYLALPKSKRPPKFWVSYTLDKLFEKFAMKEVDGLISVNTEYISVLTNRYPHLKSIVNAVIPFAANPIDIEIARNNHLENRFFKPTDGVFNIVYIGRAGYDMQKANSIFLRAIKIGVESGLFEKTVKVYFIGTSYAANGQGLKTVEPIAKELGLESIVTEETNRVSYFEGLKLLSDADFLFVPGSDNIGYTASKIYQYAWLKKPMLTLFHSSSSVNEFMKKCNMGLSLEFDLEKEAALEKRIFTYIQESILKKTSSDINWNEFEKYSARYQVNKQVSFFNKVINASE